MENEIESVVISLVGVDCDSQNGGECSIHLSVGCEMSGGRIR